MYLLIAFNVFGAAGKLAIEVSMIGFLGGTCIAFFVVIGDLAPPIIAGYIGIENSERLRIGVMLGKKCNSTKPRGSECYYSKVIRVLKFSFLQF